MEITGLLYSQIGYDLQDPKRAIIRSNDKLYIPKGTRYRIASDVSANGENILEGEVKYWGELWGSHWWEIDFSELEIAGAYKLLVGNKNNLICSAEDIKIGENLLWNESIVTVALDQLETRAKLARNNIGWMDAGVDWRESNSHSTMVIGLTDILAKGLNFLSDEDWDRVARQVIQGCDYLALCQDKAVKIGFPEGSLIHEIPNHMQVIPGDQVKAAVAFTRASRYLTEIYPEKSDEYLERAIKLYNYILKDLEPYGHTGFSYMNHGAPKDFRIPDEFMTRDLVMMMWAGVELWISGQLRYQKDVIRIARQVMNRQVNEDNKEGEFYGHFYTFDNCIYTEKANTHHHIGHDTGSTFPHFLIPFIEMVDRWYDHPDVELWKKTVKDFAYGYYLPACSQNPFYLLPEGYFKDEGLLTFCGPWHGINTSIAFAATLAVKLEQFTGDRKFRQIAVGNVQWIAGLNAGLTSDSFEESCVVWNEDINVGMAKPYSQIHGIGRQSVGCWTGVKGTIPNGFCANPQFRLVVEPTVENDSPKLYADEGWIPHAAGWISALSHLRHAKILA
ncbi:MAG: hypothetical protein ACLFPF_11160 [Halanaerobiales bacterium]